MDFVAAVKGVVFITRIQRKNYIRLFPGPAQVSHFSAGLFRTPLNHILTLASIKEVQPYVLYLCIVCLKANKHAELNKCKRQNTHICRRRKT